MYGQTFSYEAHGQTLVIHLPKELDHHNCRNLKYETDLLLSENYISKVVFDFSRTEFMDSSGIGILLNRYKQMAGSGGTQKLGNRGAAVGSQDHVLEKLAGKLPGEAEQAEGIQVIRTGTKSEKRRLLGNGSGNCRMIAGLMYEKL